MGSIAFQRLTAGIHDNQLAAPFCKLFKIGGGDGMVFDGICPNHDRDIRIFNLIKRRRYRTRTDVFQKCCHRRRMAQACTVIHIVVPKSLTDEFLKEISFFIGAFGAAKPRNRCATFCLF